MMLPRQSTTVPNTSNSRACTFALAVMGILRWSSLDETLAPLGRRDHAAVGAAEQGVAVERNAIVEPVGERPRQQAQRGQQPRGTAETPAHLGDAVELGVGAAVDQHEVGFERLGVEAVVAKERLAERRLRRRQAKGESRRRASARTAPSPCTARTRRRTRSGLCRRESGAPADRCGSCRAASGRAAGTGWRRPPCLTLRGRSARGGAGSDRPARWPSWPRRPARRGCRRRDRAGPWWRSPSRCRAGRWCAAGVRIDDVGLTAKRHTIGWPDEMPPRMPPAWLERNSGLPSLPMRISSAFSSPVSSAAAMPAPISTPLTALMLIMAAARSWSSLP